MNAKELAALLNGRRYMHEITKAEAGEAKAAGLVVLFGASDDLMEFEGAISEELGCYNGGTVYLTAAGLLENQCENSDCPYHEKEQAKAAAIEAVWDDQGPWTYKTAIQHETFEIIDDGEIYCRGIAFALADVKAP